MASPVDRFSSLILVVSRPTFEYFSSWFSFLPPNKKKNARQLVCKAHEMGLLEACREKSNSLPSKSNHSSTLAWPECLPRTLRYPCLNSWGRINKINQTLTVVKWVTPWPCMCLKKKTKVNKFEAYKIKWLTCNGSTWKQHFHGQEERRWKWLSQL